MKNDFSQILFKFFGPHFFLILSGYLDKRTWPGRHLNANDSYFSLSNSESITKHEKCDRFDQKFEKDAWLATKNFSKSFGKRVLEELLKKRFCNFNFKLIKFYTRNEKQEKLDN